MPRREQRKLAKNTDVKFTRARLKRAEATDCYTSNTTHHPASDSAEQNRSSWTRAKGSQFANRNEMGEEREERAQKGDGLIGRQKEEHQRVQMGVDRRPKESSPLEHSSMGSLFVWKCSDRTELIPSQTIKDLATNQRIIFLNVHRRFVVKHSSATY